MTHDEDKMLRERFPEVLAGLDRLARSIDQQKFPGRAWQGAPRRRNSVISVVFRASFATAAAAVLLIAATTGWRLVVHTTTPTRLGQPDAPAMAGKVDPAAEDLTIPTGIASAAAELTWCLPAAPLPSTSRDPNSGEGIDWSIPTVTFPSLKDLDDELEKDLNDSPSVSVNSG